MKDEITSRDAVERGRMTTILTESDVKAIRQSTETYINLGRRYNVSPSTIYAVRARRIWKHVPC